MAFHIHHPCITFFSTHSSWSLQHASRSSQGSSPGQPVHPTPQYLPYRIPRELQSCTTQALLQFGCEVLLALEAPTIPKQWNT